VGFGLGCGVLGFGVCGSWAQPQTPNPQSPIPNPQSPVLIQKINLIS